jgi:multicomponent Na+:H+ antiporter subunit E
VVFLGHYTRLFLRANLTVAREIVTPGSGLAPAIVALPLRSETTLEVASIAHLTPGTFVPEVHVNPTALFVHGMHAPDPDLFRAELIDLENRLLAGLRPTRRYDE